MGSYLAKIFKFLSNSTLMLKNGILQAGSVTNNQHQACQFLHGKTEKSFLIMEQRILDTNA